MLCENIDADLRQGPGPIDYPSSIKTTCIDLYAGVHAVPRPTLTQIFIGFSTHFIGICVGLGLGVGQCECTVVFGSLVYRMLPVKTLKALFTRTINVTVFASGTFDLFDGH